MIPRRLEYEAAGARCGHDREHRQDSNQRLRPLQKAGIRERHCEEIAWLHAQQNYGLTYGGT